MKSIIRNFLLFCSGANQEILRRPECAIDYQKFISLGATVFFTACLAFLSGSYAFYTIFRSVILSIVFGFLWGAVIFNLDRFMVSSLRRKLIPPNLSLAERMKRRSSEIIAVSPRLLIAACTAFVLAAPLEQKIFEPEIESQLSKYQDAVIVNLRDSIREEFPDINKLESENIQLREEVESKRNQINALLTLIIDDPSGTLEGAVFNERRKTYSRYKAELQKLEKDNGGKISANTQRLEYIKSQEAEREKQVGASRPFYGLAARLVAFSDIKSHSQSIAIVSIFLNFLFVILEASPVLVKLLSDVGPYEYFWEVLESRAGAGDWRESRGNGIGVVKELSPQVQPAGEAAPVGARPYRSEDSVRLTSKRGSTFQLRAFLCHSSYDKPAIRNLYERLQADDVDAWLDEKKILPGQDWNQEITKAIQTCDAVIICLSHQSVNKAGYVHKEIRFAVEKAGEQPENSIFIIPARLDECDIPDVVRRWQWVNLFEDVGYERLILALQTRANEIGTVVGRKQ